MKNWVKKYGVEGCYKIVVLWFLAGYVLQPFWYTLMEATKNGEQRNPLFWVEYFSNAVNRTTVWHTLVLGCLTVLICGMIGVLLAFYMTFRKVYFRNAVHLILLSPMMIPGIIIVIAYVQLYGESGVITTILTRLLGESGVFYHLTGLGGILFVHAFTQYVYFYLQTYTALKYVDGSQIEMARGLGASRFRIFKDIIYPVIRPAVIMAASVTFVSGISSYAAPAVLGGKYKVLSTQIASKKANFDFNGAAVSAIMMFLLGIVVLISAQCLEKHYQMKRNLRATVYEPQEKMGKWSPTQMIEKIFIAIVILLIVLPILIILYLSFVNNQSIMSDLLPHGFTLSNYKNVLGSARTVNPLKNSVKMAITVVCIGELFTVPLAYMHAKNKSVINRTAVFLVMAAWGIPGSVLAVNLIIAFNHGNVFSFGESLIGGYWILPIAYLIHGLPMLMNHNRIAVENFNPVLEDASQSLGAGKRTTFFKIILPSILPGIVSGSMMVIITTLGEYTMSNLLYGVHNLPISVAMLNRFTNYYFGETMAYAATVIIMCSLLFGIMLKMDRKKYI